jgi:GNAT superfamily N-acetyltransferase
MTITIRHLTAADLDAADAVLQAAYGGASRKKRLELYMQLQPDGWLGATLDGELAGVAGAVDYGAVGHVGLVAVDPPKQRRGVAMAMMQRLLTWFDQRGCAVVRLDASEDGAPLYRKLGFVEDEQTLVLLQDDCPLRPAVPECVGPLRAEDIPAVAAFDAPIFGAARAAVFAALLEQGRDRAFVARDADGRIDGYLFAQAQVIGPWVARTPADAEALLAAALALPFESQPGAIVPGSNADAAALLMRYGFSPRRSLRHMRRGAGGPRGQRALLYGQTSLAIG